MIKNHLPTNELLPFFEDISSQPESGVYDEKGDALLSLLLIADNGLLVQLLKAAWLGEAAMPFPPFILGPPAAETLLWTAMVEFT